MYFLLVIYFISQICTPCLSSNFTLKGMYAPVFTPFNVKGEVDTSVLNEYGQYLSERGVKGVYVADSTGEGPNLSEDEKKLLFKCWVSVAKKYNLRVIAQIGGGSQAEMVNLAKYCERLKVDMIALLPTLYFKPKTVDCLVELVEIVSKAAPSVPIQYMDFARYTKVELNMPEFFAAATKRVPNFIGITANLETAVQVSAVNVLKPYQSLCIRDHNLISAAVLQGYRCFTTTIINVYPLATANLIKHAMDENIKLAREGQIAYNSITPRLVQNGKRLASYKAAMEISSGIKIGRPRQPIQTLNDHERMNIEAITDDIDNEPSLNTYDFTSEDLEEI